MRRRMVLLVIPLLALTGCTTAATPHPVITSSTIEETASTAVPVALPSRIAAPTVQFPVVGGASGTTRSARGSLDASVDTLQVTITCQGAGFPSVHTSDGFTANSVATGIAPPKIGSICGADRPTTSTYGLVGVSKYGKLRYSITPHGKIVWAVTFAKQS